MSDTFITPDSGSAGGETTATIEAPQTGASGQVAPETQESEAGGGQPTAEGGQAETGQRRGKSLMDEVKELRAQRRELREQVRSFDTVRQELAELRERLDRQNQPAPGKDPGRYWRDPEAVIEEKLGRLRDELAGTFQMSREQEWQAAQLRQEQESAAEFIRSQANYHSDDDEELIEIIEQIPNRQALSPQWVAEYAWLKLQQSRGIGNKTVAKHRASGVQGQPPGTGYGQKTWSKAEFDQALNMIEKNPNDPKFNELIKELEAAHKEGRVR